MVAVSSNSVVIPSKFYGHCRPLPVLENDILFDGSILEAKICQSVADRGSS